MAASSITPTTTPATIPPMAPEDKPLLIGVAMTDGLNWDVGEMVTAYVEDAEDALEVARASAVTGTVKLERKNHSHGRAAHNLSAST